MEIHIKVSQKQTEIINISWNSTGNWWNRRAFPPKMANVDPKWMAKRPIFDPNKFTMSTKIEMMPKRARFEHQSNWKWAMSWVKSEKMASVAIHSDSLRCRKLIKNEMEVKLTSVTVQFSLQICHQHLNSNEIMTCRLPTQVATRRRHFNPNWLVSIQKWGWFQSRDSSRLPLVEPVVRVRVIKYLVAIEFQLSRLDSDEIDGIFSREAKSNSVH